MTIESRPRVVLVARSFVRRNDGKLLIMKRALTDKNNPGVWEVPGGKMDEKQLLAKVQDREIKEETGLEVRPALPHPLVYPISFMIESGPYEGLSYLVLFSITELVQGDVALSAEHTDFAWVDYDEMLSSYDLTVEVRKAAEVLKPYLM